MATKHPLRDMQVSHEQFEGKLIVKDEWSPTMKALKELTTTEHRERVYGDLGLKMIADIRRHMTMQKGYADGKPYADLKIKWRYHGRKWYTANKKNLKRAAAAESAQRNRFGNKGYTLGRQTKNAVDRRTGMSSQRGQVQLVNKTRVTATTQALIDTARLRKSWSILTVAYNQLEVGPSNPGDMLKAIWNDDRGRWYFGDNNIDDLVDRYMNRFIDELLFGK